MSRERPLLRTQLLLWLLVPLCALLAADTLVSYWIAVSFSRRAYDRSLIEIARDLSLHVKGEGVRLQLDLPEPSRRILLTDPYDRIYFEVATAAGERIAGEPLPSPARGSDSPGTEVLYDGAIEGNPVRLAQLQFRVPNGAALVRVAETTAKRDALAREILASVLAPQLLLVLIATAVVWFGVVRGLAPLARLQEELAARLERDLRPLSLAGIPGELRPLLEAINVLLARLDGLLTLQSRFIADAAHQLKTPIAGLQAHLELALRERDPARMGEVLEKLSSGLERLARLVNQILALARNEPQAASALALERVNLQALAFDVAASWVPDAFKRGVDLGFEAEREDVFVAGDSARLREMLDNLLDNAVRYSRRGGRVTVRVAASPQPVVSVSDDGPVIPPEERDRVFERFHRLLGTGQEGSGLGLSIVREIAHRHGAEVSLEADRDGVGNTFSVRFPWPAGKLRDERVMRNSA
ncbi:MAG TPA: sensor histidine kinase N-terminal domain-containing protein [Burkholderiales bacterium]|nr:sensor histidine kinase N-terminal domain-containing protein [Burkholderiales bacterium]